MNLFGQFPNKILSFYLWLIFGFMSNLLNCDLQKIIQNNIYIKHISAIIAFYFLFIIFDEPKDSREMKYTAIYILCYYIVFLLSTKSPLPVILCILFILIIYSITNIESSSDKYKYNDNALYLFDITKKILFIVIITMSLGGFLYTFTTKTHNYNILSYLIYNDC